MSDNFGSPAQRLMRCITKILLSTSNSLLQPMTMFPRTVRKELYYKKEKQKHNCDHHWKLVEELIQGDQGMMRDKDRWKPAKVMSRAAPWSYVCHESIDRTGVQKKRWHLKNSRKAIKHTEPESTEE